MTRRYALKIFRVNHRLTQTEMANRLGFSMSMYTMIERGERDGSLSFWKRLQEEFAITDAEMWGLIKCEK